MNIRETIIDGPFSTFKSTTSSKNDSEFLSKIPESQNTYTMEETIVNTNSNLLSNNSNKIERYYQDSIQVIRPELYFMDNIIANNPDIYDTKLNYSPSVHKFEYKNYIFFNKFMKSLKSIVDSCELVFSYKEEKISSEYNESSSVICYYLINEKFLLAGKYEELNKDDLGATLVMVKTNTEVKANKKDTISGGDILVYYSLTDIDEANLLIKNINKLIQRYEHSTKPSEKEAFNYINMVTLNRNEYTLSTFNIHNVKMEEDILNINYGKGFSEFHSRFMERMKNSKKGISLLHGTPGTGKTTYIRQIISELNKMDKTILYVGPEMIESIIKPDFFTFLKNEVRKRYSEDDDSNFVLILEDAEKILAARDKSNNSNSIINLLNMSDGILNDILNMQIIASFNMPVEQIDPAVLRAGRLIANKEFRALDGDNLQNALKHYEIEGFASDKATIGEIFAFKEELQPIIN
jgi:hypothetical protein